MLYGVSLHASLCLWCLFVLLLLFSLHHTLAITPDAPTTIAVTGPTASPRNIAENPPSSLARHCYLGNVLSSTSSLYPLNWSSPLQNVLSKLSPMVVFGGKGHEHVRFLCKSLEPLMIFPFFLFFFLLVLMLPVRFVNIFKSLLYVLFIYLVCLLFGVRCGLHNFVISSLWNKRPNWLLFLW